MTGLQSKFKTFNARTDIQTDIHHQSINRNSFAIRPKKRFTALYLVFNNSLQIGFYVASLFFSKKYYPPPPLTILQHPTQYSPIHCGIDHLALYFQVELRLWSWITVSIPCDQCLSARAHDLPVHVRMSRCAISSGVMCAHGRKSVRSPSNPYRGGK